MLNTSSSPSVVCPSCGSENSRFDHFCGICGAYLARVRWQAPGGTWHEGDGRLAIAEGTVPRVLFENAGVAPVALILNDEDLEGLPVWVDGNAVRSHSGTIHLLPGAATETFDIPLVEEVVRAREDLDAHEARISFLTSASSRPLRLTLVLARQPWAEPGASFYRFLPLERLRNGGVLHEIEIHNEAADQVELTRIEIKDDPIAPPSGYQKIKGEDLLQKEIHLPRNLDSGKPWTHPLRLRADRLSLPADSLGWFSATVRYELVVDAESYWISSRLRGVVGRGPSLEVKGPPNLTAAAPDYDTQDVFTIRNPGQLPVEVQAIEVLREGEGGLEATTGPDWLVLKGLAPGDVLAGGEERTLQVGYRPDSRPDDELEEDLSVRTIRFRHDGWQDAAARQLLYQVFAPFGRAKEKTLGIDFGTSNSVACLMGDRQGYPLYLELIEDGRRYEYLPSLMYFNDRSGNAADAEPFLYGEAAKSTASIEPANLVRSIKTVVIDGQRSHYRFLKKTADGHVQNVNVSPQELLNLFIRQLRTRAERGVFFLSGETLNQEGLGDRRATFRNAVFSHPVEMTETMKTALMEAAHRAGINQKSTTPDEFFQERCVDEATAAVLAYVHRLLIDDGEGCGERELKDLETILCIDIGGGTTDIAAVAVRDLATYADGGEGDRKVTVELRSKNGDRRFAGDALDQKLAGEILAHIERQSRDKGAPVLIDEVERAIASPSYVAYQTQFRERLKNDPRLRSAGETLDPYAIYSLAMSVLGAAEAAKRAFTTEERVVKTFTGAGWPRQPGSAAGAAAENFEVVLQRETFEAIVRRELEARFYLLEAVVSGAQWDWAQINTLLLTGQSMRSPIIRRPIVEYVRRRMGEGAAAELVVVEPADAPSPEERFDPKTCVAIGAAIWGLSRDEESAWLAIEQPLLEQLGFDLTIRGGPRYTQIPGLTRGTSLPAEGTITFPAVRQSLVLCRDKKRFVQFTNFKPTKQVVVRVESLAEFWVVIDGEKHRGEILL